MSEENKNREEAGIRLLEALSGIDEELLARSEIVVKEQSNGKLLTFWHKYGKACAACLCLLFLGTAFWGVSFISSNKSSDSTAAAPMTMMPQNEASQKEAACEEAGAMEDMAEASRGEEAPENDMAGEHNFAAPENAGEEYQLMKYAQSAALYYPVAEIEIADIADENDYRVEVGFGYEENVKVLRYEAGQPIYEILFDTGAQELDSLRFTKLSIGGMIDGDYLNYHDGKIVSTDKGECIISVGPGDAGLIVWEDEAIGITCSYYQPAEATEETLLAFRNMISGWFEMK